jgi:antitoxin ParD1/3/4
MEVPMPTRNVVLTDRQASLIENLVQSGRYQNASEVMREGLRLVENNVAEESAKLDALRSATNSGIADLDSGAFKEFAHPSDLLVHLDRVAKAAIATAKDR